MFQKNPEDATIFAFIFKRNFRFKCFSLFACLPVYFCNFRRAPIFRIFGVDAPGAKSKPYHFL